MEEKSCRVYITDALQVIAENTARMVGGKAMTTRWEELLNPKPKDTRTGEEIVADVLRKGGLKLKTRG